MTARVSMLLKSRASLDMFPFSLCNKKNTYNSAHEQTPLSKDTIKSVLRYWEVGRAKDLSAPLVCVYIYIYICNIHLLLLSLPLFLLLLPWSFHSVAVVLTLVQTKR